MKIFIMRTSASMIVLIVAIVLINSILWAGRQDYKEAKAREIRAERYEIMIENASAGQHEKNREFLEGGYYD